MALLNVAPTKSNLLAMRRQLEFAEEGYDLLEQKRQILIFELMSRLARTRKAETKVSELLQGAFSALKQATLDIGSEAIDRATLGVKFDHQLSVSDQHVIGIRVPRIQVKIEPPSAQFGIGGTSGSTDEAMTQFTEILPQLAELAELENAVLRLAWELRRTQRRCNALSKIFIPNYRETINYICSALEERERESLVIFKMIRDRLAKQDAPGP